MPQPPPPAATETPIAQVGTAHWVSHHLFTAGDRDALLIDVVCPAAVELLTDGIIDRFFFIRYAENGPHLRFRVRLAGGVEPHIAAEKTRAALSRQRRKTPREASAAVDATPAPSPDNIQPAVFELELERYGGRAHFPHSLEFFGLSSLDAIEFVDRWRAKRRSLQLVEILTRLARYAIGFARDRKELLTLADYAAQWREQMAPIVARAEAMYEQSGAALAQRIGAVLNQAASPNPLQVSVAHAQALAATLDDLDTTERHMVLGSHIHMAANRLGLTNPEEVYLSVLLSRCLEGLGDHPDDLDAALLSLRTAPASARAGDPEDPARRLAERTTSGLSQLSASLTTAAPPE